MSLVLRSEMYFNRRKPSIFLVSIALISLFVQLFSDFFVPRIVPFFCCAILAVQNRGFFRNKELSLLYFIATVSTISTFLAFPTGLVLEKIKSLTYLIASIFGAYVIFDEIRAWPSSLQRKYFFSFSCVLAFGVTLEQLVPTLKQSSDYFRFWNSETAYSNDFRDVTLHGSVRAKFFSKEPSDVAKMFALTSMIWLSCSQSRLRYLVFWVLALLVVFAVRSPTAVVLVFLFGTFYLLSTQRDKKKVNEFAVGQFILVGVLLFILLIGTLSILPSDGRIFNKAYAVLSGGTIC